MSYSNPYVFTYIIPAVNFATTTTYGIKAPKGYNNGSILDVGVLVTTSITATTLTGRIKV